MAGVTTTIQALLNKGMSILHKTQLGTILYNQLPSTDEIAGLSANSPTALNPVQTETELTTHTSDADAHHDNSNDPTANEKAAIAGNSGTAVSAANKLIDAADKELIKEYIAEVTTAQLVSAALTESVDLTAIEAFPANALILGGTVEPDALFSGGTISAMGIELGDAGDPDELMPSADVFTGAALGLRDSVPAGTVPRFETAYVPILKFTAVGDNVDQATAGTVQVHIWYREVGLATA